MGEGLDLDMDEDLLLEFSRQIPIFGRMGQQRILNASVAIIGVRGLGAEIAKNLALSGVRHLHLVDLGRVEPQHLAANVLLLKEDLGKQLASATAERLRTLCNRVVVTSNDEALMASAEDLKGCQAVVASRGRLAELAQLNALCRERGLPLVAAAARGLVSRVFCDFGAAFWIEEPVAASEGHLLVESVTQDCPATVTLVDEHRSALQPGDSVVFAGVSGMEALCDGRPRACTVTGPCTFTVADDTRGAGAPGAGGYAQRQRPRRTLQQRPLPEALEQAELRAWDPAQPRRAAELHAALCAAEGSGGTATGVGEGEPPPPPELVRHLAAWDDSPFAPVCSITGGIAAQEALKAVAHTMAPLQQWLHWDALDCGPAAEGEGEGEGEAAVRESSGNGGVAEEDAPLHTLLGPQLLQQLQELRWLVVGAGSLGCELLKALALAGVGSGARGELLLADADVVSRANLPSQMLYSAADVGAPKAECAARALRQLAPRTRVRALRDRVAAEKEGPFDAPFFRELSGVASAVDEVLPRLYLDARCVAAQRPLVDGGKQGLAASVAVFVPRCSESYASTSSALGARDPPVCTLKHFPYTAEHTVRWAVDLFGALFTAPAAAANAYLGARGGEHPAAGAPALQRPLLAGLRAALVRDRPSGYEACVAWGRRQFEELFANSIKQLCFNFPLSATTSSGAPFWSGTKRAPAPLQFDAATPEHLDFVLAAANLQAAVYGLEGCAERQRVAEMLRGVEVPPFQPQAGVRIEVTEAEAGRAPAEEGNAAEECQRIRAELPSPSSLGGYRLHPLSLDADDERAFHVEFVTAAASLRARNYRIPPADKLQARLMAGRILPSAVTTASVAAGLMALEIVKLARAAPLEAFRHTFFDLQSPQFVRACLLPAVRNKVATATGPVEWTPWDRFDMTVARSAPLKGFLEQFQQQHGLQVTMISYGKSLLYAEFLTKKKLQERLTLSLPDLVTQVAKVQLPASEEPLSFLFSVSCSDVEGEDVEVPDTLVTIE